MVQGVLRDPRGTQEKGPLIAWAAGAAWALSSACTAAGPSRQEAALSPLLGSGSRQGEEAAGDTTFPGREKPRRGRYRAPHRVDLFYGTPSAGNEKAKELYGLNRFSVTRQLLYSLDETQLALDLCLFVNGLPVATSELKNSLTKQTVGDAVEQYRQRGRSLGERLFELGRCLAHFAVDDHEVRFCTDLAASNPWFFAVQPWLGRRGRQPAEPGRVEDRLPVEADPREGQSGQHHRELRAGRRDKGRADGPQAAGAGVAALPPAGRGAQTASGRVRRGSWPAVSGSALGRQRQVELDRVAGPPADRAGAGRRGAPGFGGGGHRPTGAGPADPGHDQAVRPGRLRRWPRRGCAPCSAA